MIVADQGTSGLAASQYWDLGSTDDFPSTDSFTPGGDWSVATPPSDPLTEGGSYDAFLRGMDDIQLDGFDGLFSKAKKLAKKYGKKIAKGAIKGGAGGAIKGAMGAVKKPKKKSKADASIEAAGSGGGALSSSLFTPRNAVLGAVGLALAGALVYSVTSRKRASSRVRRRRTR